MDFGKFKYQQSKKQHKGQAHQTKLKEIRLRPKTGEHDIEVKVKHAREFIEHKDKVLVTVVFRGRELAHMEEGEKLINDVIRRLEDVAKIESAANRQGKRISCTLTAK
jgi:translation initiation factor IF-3